MIMALPSHCEKIRILVQLLLKPKCYQPNNQNWDARRLLMIFYTMQQPSATFNLKNLNI